MIYKNQMHKITMFEISAAQNTARIGREIGRGWIANNSRSGIDSKYMVGGEYSEGDLVHT